jgi:uncharacterized protein YutE (UPF0331/DUF86 family)
MNSTGRSLKESGIMDDRVKEHLQQLNKYCLHLMEMRKLKREVFVQDAVLQGATERFLQLAIESCLNIGNRILSLHQFQKPFDPPQTYSDIFVGLKDIGIIEQDLCERLVMMAKFRNRLVHLYWEIIPEKIYEIVQDNLEDFKMFEKRIVEFLRSR